MQAIDLQVIDRGPAHSAPTELPRTIAIVGAGFSGLSVAIQLLKHPPPEPLRILLIEPRSELGAGAAYGTRDYPYPLNVAAGQMSLDSSTPQDFLDYVLAQGIHATAADFLPRQVYGEYLRARFESARNAAPERARCIHRRASALQLRRTPEGHWELWLDDGSALHAHDVVLALGNPPPASLPVLAPITSSSRYVCDPWSIGALSEPMDSVLLVGSGLTMVDAALRLAALRPRVQHIHVLSRHGWLPQEQTNAVKPARMPDVAAALAGAHGSIRALVRAFRKLAREVRAEGGDWREIIGQSRGRLRSLWHGLDARQRARFLRHARSAWDVHRHRVPSGPLAAVQGLARKGVLEVHAGRVETVRALEDAVEVIWRPRGATKSRAWLVDRVVNCTGPDSRVSAHGDPLVQSLLTNGLIRPDPLGLGIDVAQDGRVVGRNGDPVEHLYYIGPWLRARDWEATAVPELREHALALARTLARRPVALRAP